VKIDDARHDAMFDSDGAELLDTAYQSFMRVLGEAHTGGVALVDARTIFYAGAAVALAVIFHPLEHPDDDGMREVSHLLGGFSEAIAQHMQEVGLKPEGSTSTARVHRVRRPRRKPGPMHPDPQVN
jgi:hypothetical protein